MSDNDHYRIGPGKCKCGFDAYRFSGIMLDYHEIMMAHLREAPKRDKEARARRFAEAEENSAAYWKRIADHHYEKRKEAEARAERLRMYCDRLTALVEPTRANDANVDMARLVLQPGDLDAAPDDTEGETQP